MSALLRAIHPVLQARDVEASIRFFSRLGFRLLFKDVPDAPRYAALARDHVELHLQWADPGQWAYPTDRPTYRFCVDDVDALFKEFVASGAIEGGVDRSGPWDAPGDTPWGTREFHVRDPGQNGLQFYCRGPAT